MADFLEKLRRAPRARQLEQLAHLERIADGCDDEAKVRGVTFKAACVLARELSRALVRGERHGRAKLTAADVRTIRSRLATGVRGRVLARRYCVSESLISKIKHGEVWRD